MKLPLSIIMFYFLSFPSTPLIYFRLLSCPSTVAKTLGSKALDGSGQKCTVQCCGSGMGKKIRIRDKHPGSATLVPYRIRSLDQKLIRAVFLFWQFWANDRYRRRG
jgi:hypothetical protein